MDTLQQVCALLAETLALSPQVRLTAATPLLGNLPELDSTAVIGVVTGLEERFGISVADDEIDAALFDSVGSLVAFVDAKLGQ